MYTSIYIMEQRGSGGLVKVLRFFILVTRVIVKLMNRVLAFYKDGCWDGRTTEWCHECTTGKVRS